MYEGPIIDCDVHNNPVAFRDYIEYLPSRWKEFVDAAGDPSLGMDAPFLGSTGVPDGLGKRHETYTDKGLPGSDLEMMREQLLDPFEIEAAVLGHDVGQQAALINGEFALAMCQASNDWMADRWLQSDERLYGAVLVPMQTPVEAAAEIRRVGQNDRFVSALLAHNGLARPLGHPAYHPIYAAAAEIEMPIHMHVNGAEYFGLTAHLAAGGGPFTHKFEQYSQLHQPTVNHLTSLIVHGVFEKYPNLKLLLTESGLSWLPWFARRLDANYDLMRQESVWVKKRPSDYLREHLAVATQPVEVTVESRQEFLSELSLFEGIEDMIVFTSDYPHWDADDPRLVWSIFPKEWHERIAYETARKALRLPASHRQGAKRRDHALVG